MPDHPRGTARRDLTVVGGVAFVVRVAWVLAEHRPPSRKLLADPGVYWRFAIEIARGHGYVSLHGKPTAYYPPGYPYFLGSLQWVNKTILGGDHLPLLAGLVQVVLGTVAVVFTALAARSLGRHVAGDRPDAESWARRCGMAAGLVLALWPNVILYTGVFLSETLFLAAFAVFLAAVLRMRTGGEFRRGWAVTAALALGVSTLVRPQVLIVVVGLAVAWLIGRRGLGVVVRDLVVLAVGVVLVLTPWVIRNEVVLHAFVALSNNSGDNLCVGFNPQANGAFQIPPYCNTDPLYVEGPKAELQRDAHTKDLAVKWARTHVTKLPALSVKKLWYTYKTDTDGLRAVESYEADRFLSSTERSTLDWVCTVPYLLIMAAAVIGAVGLGVAGIRRRKTTPGDGTVASVLAMAVLSAAIPVAFFGDGRFKVPSTPLFATLAGVTIAAVWIRLRPVGRSDGEPGDQPAGAPRTMVSS